MQVLQVRVKRACTVLFFVAGDKKLIFKTNDYRKFDDY